MRVGAARRQSLSARAISAAALGRQSSLVLSKPARRRVQLPTFERTQVRVVLCIPNGHPPLIKQQGRSTVSATQASRMQLSAKQARPSAARAVRASRKGAYQASRRRREAGNERPWAALACITLLLLLQKTQRTQKKQRCSAGSARGFLPLLPSPHLEGRGHEVTRHLLTMLLPCSICSLPAKQAPSWCAPRRSATPPSAS